MNNDNIREIVDNLSEFTSNLEALILLTKDTVDLKNGRVLSLDTSIERLIRDDFSVDEFENLYSENKELFKKSNLYTHTFDYLFYNSIFITSYSLFEQYLSTLGKICEKIEVTQIKVSDIKGDGIVGTIRKYLNLVLRIRSASTTENLWHDISEFRSIRNSIVHNENKLNVKGNIKNPAQVKGYLKLTQHQLEYIGEEMSFKINKLDFLEDFKVTAEKYAIMITKELIKNYR